MRSTFSRTFFPAALLLLTALLVVGFSFQLLVKNYLTGETYDDLERKGTAVASLASAYYTEGTLSGRDFLVNLSFAGQLSDADAVIFDAQGVLLLCSDAPFGCEHRNLIVEDSYISRVLQEGTLRNSGMLSGLYNEERYVVSVPILAAHTGKPVGVVMVSTPTAATHAILEKMADIYLFVSLLAVAAVTIIMSFFARRHSSPLKEMARAASAFGHGDLNARVNIRQSYSREMEELALSFNNMADSLQKSEYQRREFVANVSHELKTPMTTIGGYVDGILDGTIPPEKSRHFMQLVSEETKRLSRRVRSMLDISQLQDQGGIPEERKFRFDITECVGRTLLSFEQKILAKKLDVQVSMPEHPVYTMADQDAITQVVYNLLDNAVKFCPEGKQLELSLVEGGSKVYITVSNQGETIPPEELPLVFDRFHKLDKSRSQNRDGWGLGLYIVKTIVCSHGEDISVSSRNGKTAFTFTLPLIN